MCYYYKSPSILSVKNKTVNTTGGEISGFQQPLIPTFCNKEDDFIKSQWGFIPSFAQLNKTPLITLNARIETIDERVTYKHFTQNRCLIEAEGFYEWQWLNKSGTKKKKYFIYNKDHAPIYFAGIFKDWSIPNENGVLRTFTILTLTANELMAEIHNTKHRMPLSISPSRIEEWLEAGTDIKSFINNPNWVAKLEQPPLAPELWD